METEETIAPVLPEQPQERSRMKMMKRVLMGVGAVLLLAVGTVALALPPRITWTPNPLVTESIAPGEQATYSVTLKNTGYLPIPATRQLRVVAEGAIAPYVTVAPPTFPAVFKRGQAVTFGVTVSVPSDAPVGVSDGTLVLKRVIGKRVTEVWRAEAMYAEFTFSPIPLPPDPGEAGKVTIEGIDSDGDGVRDDVQRWIALSFPEQPDVRAGLRQYTIPLQQALLDADSEDLALLHTDAIDRAQDCLKAIVGLKLKKEYTDRLHVQMLNTRERSLAYIEYDSQLGGHVFHLLDASPDMCDYEPSALY